MDSGASPNRARHWASSVAQSAAHTVQEWTVRKYTLPDKNVASQLLMYRQVRMRVTGPQTSVYWSRGLCGIEPFEGESRFPAFRQLMLTFFFFL